MCGILGVVGRAVDVPRDRFERALGLLEHRGPDDSGVHYTTLPGGHDVALGHRRLSIIDLSTLGHQPMFSRRTGAAVVYNGEIYNFREVRTELEALGHVFHSSCDTEVLLAAYDEWGEECVTRMNGMFAFAILDVERRRLVLARDRLGIKPLYYFLDGGRCGFGSELLALAALRLAPQSIRSEAMVNYLAFGYVPGDLTPLRGYAKLRPGFLLVYDIERGAATVRRYWDALDAYATCTDEGEEALADQLEALLRDSVERQQISDVPLGAFLSAGIDSSLVVAMMCQVARSRVKTFTIGVTTPQWDEAPEARRFARYLGTDHHEQYVSPGELRAELPKIAAMYDEPLADTSSIPTAVVSRLMRQHVTVALSGDGGDELFHGYTRYHDTGIFAGFQMLPRPAREILLGILARAPSPRTERYAFLLSSPDLGAFHARRVSARAVLPYEIAGSDEPLWHDRLAEEVGRRLARRPSAEVPPAIDLLTCLPDDFLVKVDRASMAVSLEVRVPLLDHRIVEFAARAPLSAKVRGRVSKVLMKKVLGRHVPKALWDRPKAGFAIPIGDWFKGELRGWLTDELFSGDWDWTAGILDRAGVQRLVDRHMRGPLDLSLPIWALVSWKGWARRAAALAA
jgi:asparagine synthase (glutamine-hydrolysing)